MSSSRKPPLATTTAVVAVTVFMVVSTAAHGTNGYFAHGYGTASKGLAGAGVALPQDALVAAINPAGLAFVGKRYDAGVALFNPSRSYAVKGAPSRDPGTFGLAAGTVSSSSNVFVIPHFGSNWVVGERSAIGFAIYGNGGMNTDYGTNTYLGSTPTGVDLSQLFLATTYSRKLGKKHAFGATAIAAYQRFEIRGTEAFGAFSSDPASVSNNGASDSFGIGARVGYLGRLTPRFSFGASYQSRILMEEFDEYAGIFAEGGDFDVPSSATIGVAYRIGEQASFLFDVQQIYFSEVDSVGNPLLPNLFLTPLGENDGAGFGWIDITVYKAGVQWETRGPWTWRFGLSTGDQPVRSSDVFPNIVAPAVVEDQVTFGFRRDLGRSKRGINLSLLRAFSNRVTGPNPLEAPGAQQIELEMDQWELELGFEWRFAD